MQAIKPTPSQAAVVLKNFLKEQGVEMKLSKAQEAVARMQGFANWQSLAGAMDPRVGIPEGCLRLIQGTTDEYELTTPNQTYAHIMVNNIHVQVKHEDDGVVVDLYPRVHKEGEPLESIGSTYAHFAEAEPDEDGEAGSYHLASDNLTAGTSLADELLAGGFVEASNSRGITPIFNRNDEKLRELAKELADELRWSGAFEGDHTIVFSYMSRHGEVRNILAVEIFEAQAYGPNGWMTEDGLELTVYARN